MAVDTDQATVLDRIAQLAAQAMAQQNVPAALRSILVAIADLARDGRADTAEPSDVSNTENQSL